MITTDKAVFEPAPGNAVAEDVASYNLIRLFATLSVIVVHVATPTVGQYDPSTELNWWVGNFYQSVFRSGIPLFLMLTGALLLPRAEGFVFIKNRVIRVLLPFCFWVFVYLLAKNYIRDLSLEDYFIALYEGNSYHFWYVYLILSIYFLMPLLRLVLQWLKPTLVQVLAFTCIISLSLKLLPDDNTNIRYLLNYAIYLAYIVFGYYAAKFEDVQWLNNCQIGMLLIFLGFGITFFGSYYVSASSGHHSDLLYQSSMVHIFLKGLGVWIILKRMVKYIPDRWLKHLKAMSKLSFGVFLIHPLVIDHILIVRLGISHNLLHPAFGIFLTSTMCFVFSFVIIYLLSKLPLGKYTY
ncbi:acyltransferase [Pontibacter oryzae]|uniref:Acyltransferase 3 domain-containing protein n=1 Tax=Pontibacter oryzae TaxID=2304593 RepID=A0A399SIB0_9BACT|nr:acyltransferase family protein [Pontibacter oryzae]RIJ41607.1 hypothetical protein D1627_06140 [Pontibacter oryzae]